jgi:hypothetical protein
VYLDCDNCFCEGVVFEAIFFCLMHARMPHYTGKGRGIVVSNIPLAPTRRDGHARRAACVVELVSHGLTRRTGDWHQRAEDGDIIPVLGAGYWPRPYRESSPRLKGGKRGGRRRE